MGMGAPGSFTTEMAFATGLHRRRSSPDVHVRHQDRDRDRDRDQLSRLVLARMNNIEEGFREVIREVKDLRSSRSRSSQGRGHGQGHGQGQSGSQGQGYSQDGRSRGKRGKKSG